MAKVYIPSEIRNLVSQRAKNLCEYCQSQADYSTESRFAVEHIIPVSAGGNSGVDNLALSCSGCNGYKYDKTEARDPATYQLTPLFHPRVQNWAEHFSWNEDYLHIIGLTPTGRTTIETLKLNRIGLINMRRLLYSVGKHPPI